VTALRTTLIVGAALVAISLASEARAGGASLKRCLELADRNHPDILVSRAKLAHVRAQLDEAHYAPFSGFRIQGGMGLAPTLRGSDLFSPNTDVSLTSNLGLAWRADLSGVLPLWTFGKIDNLWDAAEANVEVHESGIDVARDAVRFDVRRAFLGAQLARDGLKLLAEANKRVDEAIDKLQQEVDDDEGDPIDLLKMRTFASELEVRRSEAEKFHRVALAGLRYYTGVPDLEIVDNPTQRSAHVLGKLDKYLTAARLYRPEVRMARAGIAAREAQLELSRSQLYPDVGLALSAGFMTAPEIDDQINPFVLDRANATYYGFALVFQWKLDVLPQLSRIDQAQAQLAEMQALDKKALGGVAAEVEEAWAEAVDWQKRLAAYEKAADYASQWLFTVQQAIDVGTLEDKEVIEPAKAWAEHRFNVLRATMEFNLALSKLAKVTGWDSIAPGS
jgi:outer membrane protein TolC